mmetsp:Transcript_33879/g.88170  ORF Transcript_33879/g.88170 Transcript_33879/m.88170 type:complete len:207 (+) Transcript_33879:2255-2875(+)
MVVLLVVRGHNLFLDGSGHAISSPVLQGTLISRVLHVDLGSADVVDQPELVIMMVIGFLFIIVIILDVIIVVVIFAYFDFRGLAFQVHEHPLFGNCVVVCLDVIDDHVGRFGTPEIAEVDAVDSADVADFPSVQIQKIGVVRKCIHVSLPNLQIGIPFHLKPRLELGPRLVSRCLHDSGPPKRLYKMRAFARLAGPSSKAVVHWHF